MTTNKPEVMAWYTPATKGTLPDVALNDRSQRGEPLIRLSDYEALQAECDRLNSYYKNGIDCFANPCEMHSGERAPPFSEFFERYGGRCLICVVDNNKALKSECEKLEAELATARAGWQSSLANLASHERPAYDEQQQRIAKLEAINLGLTSDYEALQAECERLRSIISDLQEAIEASKRCPTV